MRRKKIRSMISCIMIFSLMLAISPVAFSDCLGAYNEVSNFPQASYGSYGKNVKVIQRFLCKYKQGWASEIALAGGIDGAFGDTTRRLVRSFQEDRSIGVDGAVGPYTWSQIGALTYEQTFQYPSSSSQTHKGNNLTNIYCYSSYNNIWIYHHLSEGVIHFYDNGGNSLYADEFHYCLTGSYDFDNGYG